MNKSLLFKYFKIISLILGILFLIVLVVLTLTSIPPALSMHNNGDSNNAQAGFFILRLLVYGDYITIISLLLLVLNLLSDIILRKQKYSLNIILYVLLLINYVAPRFCISWLLGLSGGV